MYARIVSMKLKKYAESEFTKTFENEILPKLLKQNGFRDGVNLLATERSEVTAISFWNEKINAEEYNRLMYPDVMKTLSKVIEGTPEVKLFQVSNSTFHKIGTGLTV